MSESEDENVDVLIPIRRRSFAEVLLSAESFADVRWAAHETTEHALETARLSGEEIVVASRESLATVLEWFKEHATFTRRFLIVDAWVICHRFGAEYGSAL